MKGYKSSISGGQVDLALKPLDTIAMKNVAECQRIEDSNNYDKLAKKSQQWAGKISVKNETILRSLNKKIPNYDNYIEKKDDYDNCNCNRKSMNKCVQFLR